MYNFYAKYIYYSLSSSISIVINFDVKINIVDMCNRKKYRTYIKYIHISNAFAGLHDDRTFMK